MVQCKLDWTRPKATLCELCWAHFGSAQSSRSFHFHATSALLTTFACNFDCDYNFDLRRSHWTAKSVQQKQTILSNANLCAADKTRLLIKPTKAAPCVVCEFVVVVSVSELQTSGKVFFISATHANKLSADKIVGVSLPLSCSLPPKDDDDKVSLLLQMPPNRTDVVRTFSERAL